MIFKNTLSAQVKGKAIALLLIFTVFGTKAQERITLQQAVELTLQNNLQIKQSKLSEALSDENLKQSKLYFYPTLSASSSLDVNFGRNPDPVTYEIVNQQFVNASGVVSSSFPIFQGFRLWHQISQYKYQLEADKSNTRKIQNDLSLTVVTTYLQILSNEDVLAAARQQLELAKLQLDREQKQFDVGSKTLADLSQAKAQMATAELNVTNAQNQLDISYLNLAQLMERDPGNKFEVVKPLVDQIGDVNSKYAASDVYNKASENYPDISLAKNRTLAAYKALSVAKADLYPRLTFGASMGSSYSSREYLNADMKLVRAPFSDQINDNLRQAIGLNLSIPVFNGLSSRINVRKAKINYQNAQLSEQLAKNSFNKIIYQAVTDLRAAESNFNSATSAYESSKDAFNAIQQRYSVGLVNSLDFNQAQTDLNQKEFSLIQARYNLIFRNKIIDFYLGNPLTF